MPFHAPAYPDFEPGTVIGPTQPTVVLAARTVENPDIGAPSLLQEMALSNAGRLSFDLPIGDPHNRPTTYQLAVRSTNPYGVVERYILVPPVDGAILWPTYAGQTIYPSAVIELWSVDGQDNAIVESAITITLGTYDRAAEYLWLSGGSASSSQITL